MDLTEFYHLQSSKRRRAFLEYYDKCRDIDTYMRFYNIDYTLWLMANGKQIHPEADLFKYSIQIGD